MEYYEITVNNNPNFWKGNKITNKEKNKKFSF